MATYEELYGKRVKEFDSDPTLESSYEGQVWYDKSTGVLKSVVAFGAFASTANMGTARYGHGATGEVSSIIANGGTTGSGTAVSEEYNGSGWATGGSMNTTRFYISDFGNSQTAAVAVNGRSPGETFMNDVEEYNGTSWTSATDTPYNSNNTNTFGILTAGVSAGGNNTSSPATTTVAEYDGTNWTAGTSLPSSMRESITGGTQTAGFVASGGPGPSDNVNHFQYDGTNWTVAGNVNTQRIGAASGGTQTYAIGASGYDNPLQYLTSSSVWDGSSWAAGATVAVGRYASGKGSTSSGTSDVFCGGQTFSPPSSYPNPGATEEYNFSINTVTAAAWASGTAVTTGRYNGYSTASSPPSALLFFGGIYGVPGISTRTGKTEEFNGTSWSEQNDMPTGYAAGGDAGTQTAAISMGGYAGTSSTVTDACYAYDGTNWTSIPALPTGVGNTRGCGTSTAGLLVGGQTPSNPATNSSAVAYHYDGEGWTAGGSMSNKRWQTTAYGTQTAAVASGGRNPPGSPFITNTEEYGGTSWTTGGAIPTACGYISSNGAQTDGLVYAGESTPAKLNQLIGYDGTAYSTRPNMATARAATGSGGGDTSSAAVAISGDTPQSPSAMTTAVEEFTAETSAVSFKTLTTS